MKRILKLQSGEKEFLIEEIWSSYMYSYVYLFINKYNIPIEHRIIKIEYKMLNQFVFQITNSLRDLLNAVYVEPSNKEIQRHSTRFEKFIFEGNKYKVNYRMNESGRLMYAMYNILIYIIELEVNQMNLYIETE